MIQILYLTHYIVIYAHIWFEDEGVVYEYLTCGPHFLMANFIPQCNITPLCYNKQQDITKGFQTIDLTPFWQNMYNTQYMKQCDDTYNILHATVHGKNDKKTQEHLIP